MNKKKILVTAAKVSIPIIILVILVIIRFGLMNEESSSIAKFAIVSVEGLNTRGTATVSIDQVGLYSALAGKDAADDKKEQYKGFVDSINVSIDKSENLSNGDILTITVSYDEALAKKLGIKYTTRSREYKITGLKNGESLDAFADIKIITGGISPYVYVTYTNDSDDEYLSSIEYEISKTSGLSIGDEIIITCKADDESAAAAGYYIDTKEMKYTITEADRYVSDTSDISSDLIDELSKENIEVIGTETEDTTTHMSYIVTHNNSYLFRDNNEEAKNFAVYKALLANNSSGYEQKHENYLLLFYKGSIALPTYSEASPYEYVDAYFCFIYSDAVITREGDFLMATNDPKLRYVCADTYESALDQAKEQMGSGYDTQEIALQ